MNPSLSLNPVDDLNQLLRFPFMVHALQAGTIVAVLAAVAGWYMVLRRQTFAGHTLSLMAFPGAAGAALAGLPTALGYYLACGAGALVMSRSRQRVQPSETALIGTVQAVGLAIGFLFLSLDNAVLGGLETLLFGSILGVSSGQVVALLVVAVVSLALLALASRPLLFATIDPEVARARGVPVAALDAGFLLVLALAIAATSQITGVLLVFALLVAPAAAAQQITTQPLAGLTLSVVFALLVAWLGLGVAYFSPYPAGFWTTTFAFGLYVIVRVTKARGHSAVFAHEFVRNAYLAGTFIALACGVIGWLVVLRGQVFAGDALSHVAFVGAIGAAVLGLDERVGLFALTLALAATMAALGRRSQADDVEIGITFAWILGIGVLALTLLATSTHAGSGITAANTLFGQIYTLGRGPSLLAAGIGLGVAVLALAAFRPLVLSTLDPELAVIRGVRVRLLGTAFLLLLAVVTAESTQAVGALLLLGLLAAPAGAAHLLTARPYRGVAISVAIALAAMWGGLAISYAIPSMPPSTAIIGLAAAAYVAAGLVTRARGLRGRPAIRSWSRGPRGGPAARNEDGG